MFLFLLKTYLISTAFWGALFLLVRKDLGEYEWYFPFIMGAISTVVWLVFGGGYLDPTRYI